MRDSGAIDRRVAALAASHHGVLTVAELRSCGLTANAIATRVASGRLHRVGHGVYAVGHRGLAPDGRLRAAVLAAGAGAALSHRSAAHLWGLVPSPPARIDVTVPTLGGVRRRRGVVLHRTRTLAAADLAIVRRVPVTAPARTLLDLAAVVPARRLERALNEAEVLGLDVHARLHLLLAAHPRRPGTPRLREALARVRAAPSLTRSELEDRLLALCDVHGLPRPAVNRRVHGHEVDAVWRAARVAVELDGFAFHRTRQAFERDRIRDAELTADGWRVVRITYRRLDAAPEEVAMLLRTLLGQRGGT